MITLANRGAIIAGTRRIGELLVQRLAREGVNVAVLYRNSREGAESQVQSAQELGVKAVAIEADLSNEGQVKAAVAEATAALGDVSFCVNLASNYPRASLDELDLETWEEGMSVARGTFLLGLHASRAMASNPGTTKGHLVFFGDWAAAETPYTDYLPYLTGKAAVHFMTRAFARELAPQGILVNAILPGPTARPADIDEGDWTAALANVPLLRESSAEDITEVITTLLRLETVTGESIRVDSGRHLAG